MVGISMGAALLGSAVIGGVGSAISGSKNSKAIRQAQAAQTTADAQSLAAQKEARNQNVAFQTPLYNTGISAMNRRNALLGLGSTGPMESPQMGTANGGNVGFSPSGMGGEPAGNIGGNWNPTQPFASFQPNALLDMAGYQEQPQAGQVAPQTNELAAAQQGFTDWRDNTGYKFRFNEGIRAVDAGAPVRNSGSTIKARTRFGQDIGSAEFYNFFGALGEQQNLASGAANALAGVNTTFANNASNIAQNTGNNAANAAIARANNTSNTIGGITSSFGNALGQYGGYKGWF